MILVMGVAAILGVALTVIYYFSRYLFKTEYDVKPTVPKAEAPPLAIEEVKAPSLSVTLRGTRGKFLGQDPKKSARQR